MKNLIGRIFLVIVLPFFIFGCNHPQGRAQLIYPWDGHIFPFCTDENPYGITYESGTTGYAAFPRNGQIGCLNSSPGPVWYYMQIDRPGDLLIYIEQYSHIGHKLLDVDFACWGPFEAESKRDFLEKLRNSYRFEVDAHPNHRPFNGDHSQGLGGYPYGNLVDCSYDPAGTEWCYIPHAKSGEWYLLLITNYSQIPGKIHFERVDNKSTATTRCDVTVPVVINPVPKDLKQIDAHISAICLYEEKALIPIELETDDGFTFSHQSLSKTKVNVFANGKTYNAKLVDEHFECEIDIENDTTAYYAIVECPDPEFRLETEKHFLVRTADCEPSQVLPTTRDTIRAGSVDFTKLKRGDTPIVVNINDEGRQKIRLDDYDIEVEEGNPFVKEVQVSNDDNNLKLIPKLRGDWCECFVPDSLTFSIRLIPKGSAQQTTPILFPITIGVVHQSGWLGRCLWDLIALFGLLLLFFYLRALLRKRRFAKNAMVNPVYYRNGAEVKGQGQRLRDKSFLAWFTRWLLPGDEKRNLKFSRPNVNASFVASESGEAVYIPKKSINNVTMAIDGYNPQTNENSKQPVRLGANGRINVTRANGSVSEGYVYYASGDKNDGGGYRLVITILIVLDIVSIAVLLFALIKNLL